MHSDNEIYFVAKFDKEKKQFEFHYPKILELKELTIYEKRDGYKFDRYEDGKTVFIPNNHSQMGLHKLCQELLANPLQGVSVEHSKFFKKHIDITDED